MPHLHRTNSVASWWSDNHTPGATFSLHAAAKPLMKMLYSRQARETIESRREDPLDARGVAVLRSYLEYQYISVETRVIVLKELIRRAGRDAQDAAVIANAIESDGYLLRHLVQQSEKPKVVKLTCDLVRELAKHAKAGRRVCAMGLAPLLAQLSRSEDPQLACSAWSALCALNPSLPDRVSSASSTSLASSIFTRYPTPSSSSTSVASVPKEQSTSRLSAASLVSIAQRSSFSSSSDSDSDLMPEPNSTNELQPDPELYTGLVGLMASSDASTRTRAWFGLSYISDTLAGAQSVLRAGALTFAGEHLLAGDEDSDDDGLELAEWVCLVIGNISKYRSTLAAVLAAPEIVERIVSLVQNANTSIRRSAILALHNITLYHEGAQSVMAAGALECLDVDLIQREEDTRVLYWAARLLANLARHRVAGREGLTPRIREINEHPQADERVSRAARFASRKLDGKKSGRGSGRHP